MSALRSFRLLVSAGLLLASCRIGLGQPAVIDAPGARTSTSPQAPQTAAPPLDPNRILADLAKSIEGKEKDPAEKVWKNIRSFNGRPAAIVLRAMNGFSRALGVSCNHCHTVGQWEKDDLPAKQIARDMVAMVGKIDDELLKNIKNLTSKNPQVSCSTCHRGQTKPETKLPDPKPDPKPST